MVLRRLASAVVAALTIAAAITGTAGGAGATEAAGAAGAAGAALARGGGGTAVSPLGPSGRWLVDEQGRTVILHGFNMAAKTVPYDPAALGFGEDDAAFLAAHGFNTVRLNLILSELEPEPGKFNERYLSSFVRTVNMLSRHGIRTLLVFSQELLSTRFRGEGMPDWMVQADGLPDDLLNTGMFNNLMFTPALQRAYDNIWRNAPVQGKGLQDWYAEAWAHVAARFRGNAGVVGYDLWNEPWPGSTWPTCLPPIGCPSWQGKVLAPFFNKVIKAVHTADPDHLAFYEPSLMATIGSPLHMGKVGDARSGLSFHAYCADLSGKTMPGWFYGLCDAVQQFIADDSVRHAERTGAPLILSEFGASPNTDEIAHVVQLADRMRLPWIEWTYCRCKDPTEGGTVEGLVHDLTKKPGGANVNMSALNVMDEPYPQAIAGVIGSYGFDPKTSAFTLRYRPRGRAETVVYTSPLHYPKGYAVAVSGARVTSAPGASRLTLRALPGASGVSVTLTPRSALS